MLKYQDLKMFASPFKCTGSQQSQSEVVLRIQKTGVQLDGVFQTTDRFRVALLIAQRSAQGVINRRAAQARCDRLAKVAFRVVEVLPLEQNLSQDKVSLSQMR